MTDPTSAAGAPTSVPAYSLPEDNMRVVLSKRPVGIPQPGDFVLERGPAPEPAAGEILVRNIYLSVDPAQRGWASSEANYSAQIPLGGTMRALAVGVVVKSRNPDFAEGEFLYGWFDWQDYAAVDASKVVLRARLPLPLEAFAGLLGINGLTAYLGLIELGRPAAGDTLLVSTAAGAVGSLVGQIGKLLGCATIGLTGDDEKVALCRSRFHYDHAFNYKTSDVGGAGAGAAPNGVNVFFDNTGGAILDAGLRRMAVGGRVVQCGTASIASWTTPPTGLRNEREVMTRRLVWSGFVIFDHRARFEAAAAKLAQWHAEGKLVSDSDISAGIENAPGAIASLYAGENKGKKLIRLG
jgi:NADPH-dependent curcumin reductase CurA